MKPGLFDTSPFIVIWEVTRACELSCLHCRAEAQPKADPRQLTTEEGFRLLDQIKEFGNPVVVFTGGDPLMRPDLFELIRYGVDLGLRVSMTPSATPHVTKENMQRARDAGLSRWAFSLDGSTAEIHDAFRGFSGSYDVTMRAVEHLHELGLPVQINTTVSRYNVRDLDNMAALVEKLGAVLWSVFFLVPTGRGRMEDMISPDEHEQVFHWLYEVSKTVPYDIKTTAAQHYRRVVMQRNKTEKGERTGRLVGVIPSAKNSGDGIGRSFAGVNDGNGFVFISHRGDVQPSGFLPVTAGNVRENRLTDLYRHSPVFTALRNPDGYKGKCGICPYRTICGGSRARAYAVTGDYLASEPYCTFIPPGYVSSG